MENAHCINIMKTLTTIANCMFVLAHFFLTFHKTEFLTLTYSEPVI